MKYIFKKLKSNKLQIIEQQVKLIHEEYVDI